MVTARLAVMAVAASSLFSGVFALPHLRHMNKHVVRDTVIEYVPARVEKHIVCDQYGNTISVSYTTVYPEGGSRSTSKRRTTTPSIAEAAPTYQPAPVVPEPAPATTTAAPVVEQPAPVESAPATYPANSNADAGSLGKGLVYSPYNSDHSCKSKDGVAQEMREAFITRGGGFKWVRIYGVDCDQVYNVLSAAYDLNIKVMLGIYEGRDAGNFNKELGMLKDQVKRANADKGKGEKDWSQVALVNVGNEVVNFGGDAGALMGFVGQARASLKECGYNGPVGTADVWHQYKTHPALCGDDDIVAVNMHPFFDGACTIDNAGQFLKDKAAEVSAACNGKKVIIVETGWPSAGNPLGAAVPGQAQQDSFLAQAEANLDTYIILSAFNENWKTENTAAHVEKFWGIYGNPPAY